MSEHEVISILRTCPPDQRFMPVGGYGSGFSIKVLDEDDGSTRIEVVLQEGQSRYYQDERLIRFWEIWQVRRKFGLGEPETLGHRYVLAVFEWIQAQKEAAGG